MICMYLKILENIILYGTFLVVWSNLFFILPFGSMVKFILLAQFPVDQLPHSVVFLSYILLILLCSICLSLIVSSLSLNNPTFVAPYLFLL